jgi:hypothetical protein
MKTKTLFGAAALLTGSLLAAQAGPADDVTSAAQKLAGEASYTWHTATVVPDSSRFKPGPEDGKIEKGSVTYDKFRFGDDTTEVYMKGTNAVLTDPDGGWQTLGDVDTSQGPGRFMIARIKNFQAPAAQAADLVTDAKDLEQTNGAYASDLTEAGAKKLLTFRRGRGGSANITNPSGTVMFWVNNGELTKYEIHVKGTVSFNGNDMDIDRDTTVEIKDIGATKIDLPDDVKKKLQ